MNAIRAPMRQGIGVSAIGGIDPPDEVIVDIHALQDSAPVATTSDEQWSGAVRQLLRIARSRSAAQLHRERTAFACRQGEIIASRAKRCTGWSLSACAMGILVLWAFHSVAESILGNEDGPESDTVSSGFGVAAYLLLATALGTLCVAGGLQARARLLRCNADRASTRVEEVAREFDAQRVRVLTSEHELRISHVRSALDEVLGPVVLTALIEEYIERPPGT